MFLITLPRTLIGWTARTTAATILGFFTGCFLNGAIYCLKGKGGGKSDFATCSGAALIGSLLTRAALPAARVPRTVAGTMATIAIVLGLLQRDVAPKLLSRDTTA